MTSSLGESALRVPQTSPTQIPPKKTSSTSNPPLHPVLKSCRKRSVPAQLDLHYITDQILVTSAPVEALQPTYKDIGRNPQPPNRTSSAEQTEIRNTSAALSHAETPLSDSEPKDSAIDPAQTSSQRKPVANHAGSPSTSLHGPQVSSIAAGNSAVDLSLFLETQFASANYLLVCLSDKLPDDHFLILLRRQIVRLPWTAPGSPASETPTVSTLLRFCYLLHAWLHDPEHVVVVYCENGKTRSGLAVAAYLAFAGMSGVETCAQGFAHFVSCRCPEAPDPRAAFSSLPASLRLLFRNFDQGMEAGLKRNREPLLLRAISLQGVPVEEKPCLDIWDARGRHIYSSHPDLWDDLLETIPVLAGNDCYNLSSRASQWANEEGFFKVNVVLEGDFCLLCRFGGAHANKGLGETSTQLFRYVNTTVAMSTGQCELHFMHVDVMRRYVPFLNSDDFLLTLVLEADWNCRRKAKVPLLLNSCNAEAALDFLKGDKARKKGWQLLSAYHAAQPSPFDSACFVETLETSLQSCPSNLIALALQLSNFDYKAALNMLMKRSPCPWRQGLNWGDDPTAHADAPTALVQDTVYSLDTASQGSATDSSLSGFTRCSGEPSRREDRANNGPPLVPSKTSREGPISPIPLEALENLEATDFTSEMSPGAIVPQQILDLNEEAIFSSRLSRSSSSDNKLDALFNTQIGKLSNPKSEVSMELAIKADPRFEKYYKMHAVGLPEGAIRNACVRDGVDASFLDLDWDRSYESQSKASPKSSGDTDSPMKSDPRFEKYYKMHAVGLPEGAIRNACVRDGVDASFLGLDWDRSYESQSKASPKSSGDTDPPMKSDPRFEKYYKMHAVGLPEGAIRNACVRDGVDASFLGLDWDRSYESQSKASPKSSGDTDPPMKSDPRFEKYYKMHAVGLPEGAIRNACVRDGVDASFLGLDWDRSYESQSKASPKSSGDTDPPMKSDPRFEKYHKMHAVGLPEGAIRDACVRDGVDASFLDLDWDRSYISQTTKPINDDMNSGTPVKDDPEYAKYFKMLHMGLPPGAVENALTRDGKDPKILKFVQNKSVDFQLTSGGRHTNSATKEASHVRRKKIYWNTLDHSRIKEDSLWTLVRNRVHMSHLNYDVKEFKELFTESADPAQQRRKKQQSDTTKAKKSVQVIDGKRSMNGGIILLRLKLDYKKIARLVNNMEHGKLDATQIMALKEFLPSIEERRGLSTYMKTHGQSDETKMKAYRELSECEKYMFTMMEVSDAPQKFDCMLFRVQFKIRFAEVMESVRVVQRACEEVRSSERLREILAIILTLVNEINTGGDGKGATGFSLDTLLKLDEAKAFDKKTSVLQYLAKLLKQNDESLLAFKNDLIHVPRAEGVIVDSIAAEITSLDEELGRVHETAKQDADKQSASGSLKKLSVNDLKEQRTSVRNIETVPQYNQIDHLTGRTPMERFTVNAAYSVKDALTLFEKVKAKYASLLSFFGEDDNMASNEFFGTMNRFIVAFDIAAEQVRRDEIVKGRNRQRWGTNSRKLRKAYSVENVKHKGGEQAIGAVTTGIEIQSNEGGQTQHSVEKTRGSCSVQLRHQLEPQLRARSVNKDRSKGASAIADSEAASRVLPSSNEIVFGDSTMPATSVPTDGITASESAQRYTKRETTRSLIDAATPVRAGGIAEIVAAAAAKRSTERETSRSPVDLVTRATSVPAGGIAALAAAAAAKRSDEKEMTRSPVVSAISATPVPAGRIVVATAAQRPGEKEMSRVPSHSLPLTPAGAIESTGTPKKSLVQRLQISGGPPRLKGDSAAVCRSKLRNANEGAAQSNKWMATVLQRISRSKSTDSEGNAWAKC